MELISEGGAESTLEVGRIQYTRWYVCILTVIGIVWQYLLFMLFFFRENAEAHMTAIGEETSAVGITIVGAKSCAVGMAVKMNAAEGNMAGEWRFFF